MSVLGVDISHHQGAVDFGKVKAAGRDFVVMKATEGVGFSDDRFAGYRRDARNAGLVVGIYHFARAGDPATEAAYFARTVGRLQPGEFAVLDWEVPHPSPPSWSKTWLDAARATLGVKPLIYLNSSTMRSYNWSPVVAGDFGLWLAKYDNSTAPPAVTGWGAAAMKQYSDRGSVPGIAGGVDLDVFYGDRAALLRYGATPAPTPASDPTPAPVVQGEIAVKYHSTPDLADLLGAPVTPELGCPDGVGRFNHFANDSGSIYWTPQLGAFSVHGAIAQAWASLGWEKGPLGYPVSDEFGVDGFDRNGQPISWRQSNFEHGCITWTPDGGPVVRAAR